MFHHATEAADYSLATSWNNRRKTREARVSITQDSFSFKIIYSNAKGRSGTQLNNMSTQWSKSRQQINVISRPSSGLFQGNWKQQRLKLRHQQIGKTKQKENVKKHGNKWDFNPNSIITVDVKTCCTLPDNRKRTFAFHCFRKSMWRWKKRTPTLFVRKAALALLENSFHNRISQAWNKWPQIEFLGAIY